MKVKLIPTSTMAMNTLMNYDLETLIRAVEQKKKIQEHKGFEIPSEVWKEVMSYFHQPIDKYLEKLSLANLHKTLGAVYKIKMLPWTRDTKYSMEHRRNVVIKTIHKYHKRCDRVPKLKEYLGIDAVKPALPIIELNVGDLFEWKSRTCSNYVCVVKKVNNKTYGMEMYSYRIITKEEGLYHKQVMWEHSYGKKNLLKTDNCIRKVVSQDEGANTYVITDPYF